MKKPNLNRRSLRQGGYLAAVTAAVAALVLLVNLIVGQLPSNLTEFDLTDNSLYDFSDTSRDFLAALDQDVEIHVLSDESSVDSRIVRFLHQFFLQSKLQPCAGCRTQDACGRCHGDHAVRKCCVPRRSCRQT